MQASVGNNAFKRSKPQLSIESAPEVEIDDARLSPGLRDLVTKDKLTSQY